MPNPDYHWDFGDGTTSIGASVVHAYATGGTYPVRLSVTDRGGNQSSITQEVTVLGRPASGGNNPELRNCGSRSC